MSVIEKTKLPAELVAAAERMRVAADSLERGLDGTDKDANVEERQAAFDAAIADFDKAKVRSDQFDKIAEARSRQELLKSDEDPEDTPEKRAAKQIETAEENIMRTFRWWARPKGSSTEPATYRFSNSHEVSFFGDLYQAKSGNSLAGERLERHRKETEQRAMNSTAGTGGELVTPIYLNDMYVPVARVGRPIADAIGSIPLPPNTNSLNIPRVATGTSEAAQSDGGTVSSTDATTNYLTLAVCTIAGQVDVSRQLLERATPGLDQILFPDLVAAQNAEIDRQVVTGSGSGGQMLGILNTGSVQVVTFTSGSPTVPLLYPKLADGVFNRVATLLFRQADAMFMHPRRWGWVAASLDTQNRPLILPTGRVQNDGSAEDDAFNPVGLIQTLAAQGFVGQILGLPIIVDANIPTNGGAGANQDTIIIARSQEYKLWEDNAGPYVKVFEQTLSNTLQVRLQCYQYAAFTAGRFAAATALVQGTGLVTPTF